MTYRNLWGHAAAILLALALGPAARAAAQDIPFARNAQGNILVEATLNGRDKTVLMLHTASSGVTLTEAGTRAMPSMIFETGPQVQAWGGSAESRISRGNSVTIGPFRREGLTIFENKNSGDGTSGKFGLDFFEGRAVEIDFDRNILTIHDALPDKVKTYAVANLTPQGDGFLTPIRIVAGDAVHETKFLVHTGYAGGLLLDDGFSARSNIADNIAIKSESALMDSYGNTIKVKSGSVKTVVVAGLTIRNVPVGFFSGATAIQDTSVMGMAVLSQFNMIFDPAQARLYLTPRGSAGYSCRRISFRTLC